MIYPTGNQILYPEYWLPINHNIEYFKNIYPYYIVSTYGRIFNANTKTYLPKDPMYNKDKYINIVLSTKDGQYQCMMHRIVMYTFNYFPGCELLEINHKDGVKYHNWLWNLEWITHKENMKHAVENNLMCLGEDRLSTKLTEDQVREICVLIQSGMPLAEISSMYQDKYPVNMKKTIYNIASGHCWKWVSKDYDFSNITYSRKFND